MESYSVAGVLLAVPAIIDLCLKYGEVLHTKIKLFLAAERHTRLRRFVVDLLEGGLNEMLGFFRDISDQLSSWFSGQLRDSTRILQNALVKAIEAFPEDSSAEKKGFVSKLKYALYDAKRIDEACKEMEDWYERFQKRAAIYMTYVLQAKLNAPHVRQGDGNSELSVSARLRRIRQARHPAQGPLLIDYDEAAQYVKLDNTSLWISVDNPEGPARCVEYREYGGMDKKALETLRVCVHNVAQELRQVDPATMGILQCQGFSAEPLKGRFSLHFSIPEDKENPQSLRTLLADPRNRRVGRKHSISDRMHLAKSIASAVLYVHSAKFVHKNIRPENVIVLEPKLDQVSTEEKRLHKYPYAIGEPYLVGYDGVRPEEAESLRTDVVDWAKRLYCAPERLDNQQRPKFTMKHDVYSIGVVLLEIALWEDFTDRQGRVGQLLRASQQPWDVLIELCKQVPRLLGDKYRDAVVSCLQELETERSNHTLSDEDGIVVGEAYISQVMSKLEQISV